MNKKGSSAAISSVDVTYKMAQNEIAENFKENIGILEHEKERS